jgi:hypothetical protein
VGTRFDMPVSEVPSRHLTIKLLYFLLLMYVRLAC